MCAHIQTLHTTHIYYTYHTQEGEEEAEREGGAKTALRGKLQDTLFTQVHTEKCFSTSSHLNTQKSLWVPSKGALLLLELMADFSILYVMLVLQACKI